MTPKEIAAHLMDQTVLNDETMASFHGYHEAKRATGAPTDLEYAVVIAAQDLQYAADALTERLSAMQRSRADMLSGFGVYGVKMGRSSPLLAHDDTETLHLLLRQASERFRDAVKLWSNLAGRIVATDADRAAHAEKTRERRAAALASMTMRDLRAKARDLGVKVGTDRAETVAAILAAGGQ